MYLKKVEIHGFKSFADRIEIEFEKGITGVVGPNGSGKSNISDAIRWVLGEQSAKTLRGSKMEDIIFAGTTKRKPVGMAEVTLTLDNSNLRLPLDYSEVSVTRRVYRSGESEYYLNKSLCRLKDIREMFMDTGVGIDGYSIIGQGRIDEILSNKSEDRRLLFEEAAGIVKYKTRKEEAEKKLNNTTQNLVRVNDIIDELEARIEPLRIQSKKAKEFIQIRDEMKTLEINVAISELEQLKNNIETLREQNNVISSQLADYLGNKSRIEEKYLYYRNQLTELDETINQLQDNIYVTLHSIDKKEGELNLFSEKAKNMTDNKVRIEKENYVIEENISTLNIQFKDVNEKLSELVKEMDIGKQLLDSKIEELEKLSHNLKQQEEAMESSKSNVIELLNTVSSKRNELHSLDALRTNIIKRLDQIAEEMIVNNNNIDKISKEEEKIIDELARLKTSFDKSSYLLEGLTKNSDEVRKRIQELNIEIESCKNKLNENKTRKKLLEEMQKDYEGFSQSVKNTLIHAKANKEIGKGIKGVVAELIEVPKGLEVAIEVALGGAMQNIVCNTAEDANRVITYLKKHNFGRVTFLPIDNIKTNSQGIAKEQFFNEPGFINLAIDSIDFSKDFQNVFDFLLSKVLIVDKIENGIMIAKKTGNRFKIVSLEGDVINPGGSITGGSYRSKTASLLSRKREIAEIDTIITTQLKEFDNRNRMLQDLTIDLDMLNKEIEKNQNYIKEQEIDILKINNEKQQIHKEKDYIKQNIERLSRETEQLTNDRSEILISMDNIKKEIEEILKNKDDNESSISDVKAIIEDGKTIKEKISIEATNLRVTYASLKEKKVHYEEIINDIFSKIKQLEASRNIKDKEILELKMSINKLEENLKTIEIELKDSKILKQQYEFNLSQIKEKKNNISKSYLDIESELKKISEVITELQDSNHRIEMRLTRLEMQQESLLNKLWEEYEVTYLQVFDYKEDDINIHEASKQIKQLKNRLKDIGNVNITAIEEYKEVVERHEFLTTQKEDLISARNALNKVIKEMEQTMRIQFLESFEKIKVNFHEVFKRMFGGGRADIKLENEEEILTTGIEIVAQPPGKKLQNLLLLSGGERALTAIALLFAILMVKPTPFCILDEIEAALDDANVYRFADFLKEFSKDTQFIVVTHRKGTMESVDALYGITMQEEGVSTLVSVKLTEKAS